MSETYKPYGMTAAMWAAYRETCENAGICPPKFKSLPTIVQTIGNAPASAGMHKKDGEIDGVAYCAAIDISVKGFWGLTGYNEKQIRWLLFHLALNGYAAWYRYRLSFAKNRHIHAVYVGHHMKSGLQLQVRDFVLGRDGLAGHATEPFWRASRDVDAVLLAQFLKANPECAGWFKEVKGAPAATAGGNR